MPELPKLPNLLGSVEIEDEEENKIPEFKGLLSDNQTSQQKSYAELMPGNTNYIEDDNKEDSKLKEKPFSERDNIFNTTEFERKSLLGKVGEISSNVLNTVAGSGGDLGAGVASSLDSLVDFTMQEDKQTWFEDYAEGSKKFAQERFEAGAWEDNLNVVESVKQGNIGEAISKAVQGSLQNSAQLVTITTMGLMSGGTATAGLSSIANPAGSITLSGMGNAVTSQAPLALITASAQGSKYAELDDREDLSINQKMSAGLLSGGLEAATETWGSLKYLDDIANSVPGVDKTIRSEIMRYAKSMIDPKKLLANGITEAKEEYIAEFGNALFDSMMGISDKTLPEVIANQEPYLNSAAIGFTSGLGMSGTGQAAQLNQLSEVNQDINNRQQKADQFINWIEEGSNFNVEDEAKQALWEEAINVNNPSEMYRWFQTAEEKVRNGDTYTFEEASKILDDMMGGVENLDSLTNRLSQTPTETDIETTEEIEQSDEIENPLEVSDEDVPLQETQDTEPFSDVTDQQLRGLREGVLKEMEFSEDYTPGELESIEEEMDKRGLSYVEEIVTEDTEPTQIQEEDTTDVEEPTEEEGAVETQSEQSVNELNLEGASFDELNNLRNQLQVRLEEAAKDSTVPTSTVNEIREQIVEVDNKLAEVATQDDTSMVRMDNVTYTLEETFKKAEANNDNLSAEELIGRANERLVEQGENPISQQEIEENDILGEWKRTLEINDMLPQETESVEVEEETTEETTEQEIVSDDYSTQEAIDRIDRMLEEGVDYDPAEYEAANNADVQTDEQKRLVMDIAFNDHELTSENRQKLIDKREELQSQLKETTEDEEVINENEVEDVTEETEEPLTLEDLDDQIDDLMFELEEAETESEQYEIRQQIDELEQQRIELIDSEETTEAEITEPVQEVEEETVETEEVIEDTEPTGEAINFNSATREDLLNIDGIGSVTADRIIEFRENNSQFESIKDLLKVKGIGQSTLSKLEGLNLDFETVEMQDTDEEVDVEPDDTEIVEDEDVENEAENLDVDEVISEVEDKEGTARQTNELLSEEARDLLEFEGEDIRETLDVAYFTSLEDLRSMPETDRQQFIDEIRVNEPDTADAIEAEIEERNYEFGDSDFYASKYNKSNSAKQKEQAKNILSDDDTDGTFEGIEPATRRNIENIIRTQLEIPLRYGKLDSRDSNAQYDTVYKVIRTRDYSNMEVTAHEVGHYLSQILDLDVDSFPELSKLLEDEGLAEYYDPSIWREEGNSEFFKYYFNAPGEAKVKAPNYFDYVESIIQGSDMYESIKALQNEMVRWNMQSPEQRMSGAMSREGLDIKPLLSMKDKITRALVDEDITFKEALEQAGYDVENMPAYKNPWKLKRLYASVNDIVDKFLTKTAVDSQGRPVGKPLLQILKPVEDYIGETEGREFGDFEVYSLALHALEREAKFLARELESEGNDKGKIATKRINKAIDDANIPVLINTLQMVEQNPAQLKGLGLQLETENYNFRASGININDIAETVNKYDSKLFRNTMKELQKYQNTLIDYAEYYGMLGEEEAKRLKGTYNFHMPMQRYFGEELVNEAQDTIRYADLPEVVKSAYGSKRIIKDPIRSLVRDTAYMVRQSNKNNITTKLMQALDAKKENNIGYLIGREITTDTPIDKENVISYRVNGEIKARVVHPDIYKALQGLNEEESHILRTLLKPLEYSNSLFKRFAVINPKFWLNNLGRDELRQMIYEDTNGIDKLKLFSTFVDGWSSAFDLDRNQTKGIFEALGGARGGFSQYLKDIDNPETLKELMSADKVSKNPLTWLGDVAQATEDRRRLGMFINKVGKNTDVMSIGEEEAERVLKEAAYFAKGEVLEDYSIKGSWTKEIDRYAAPFSAAGVTGARHLYNKLKQSSSLLNGILYVTMPALYLWFRNKDRPEYQELPAWKKMLYFNWVKDNGKIISFPKPFITGYFFGAIPEMLANFAYNENSDEFKNNFLTVLQSGAPNYKMAGGLAAGYEVLTNRADPLGSDYQIIPDSEKFLDPEDQYGDYNSEFAKVLGSAINVSPRIIDHLFEGQFTGTYSMGTNIVDYMMGAKDFKEATLGIVGVYSDPYITSTTVNNLYEDREKYNTEMSKIRDKFKLKQDTPEDLERAKEIGAKYSQLNSITDIMAKYRQVSKIIDTLDIDEQLKENAKKYINIKNINFARGYYDRDRIYLDDVMKPEEVERINELINWVQNNY